MPGISYFIRAEVDESDESDFCKDVLAPAWHMSDHPWQYTLIWKRFLDSTEDPRMPGTVVLRFTEPEIDENDESNFLQGRFCSPRAYGTTIRDNMSEVYGSLG